LTLGISGEAAMKEFLRKHEARIHGVLSCFDRMLFRGYLPIMSGWSMAQFLKAHQADRSGIKPFLLENAERVKAHAIALAKKHQHRSNILLPPFERRMQRENWPSATASNTGWCVSSPCSSLAAPSPCTSSKAVCSCNQLGVNACTCTSTSWIAISA
jgi:hypothetical protein